MRFTVGQWKRGRQGVLPEPVVMQLGKKFRLLEIGEAELNQ